MRPGRYLEALARRLTRPDTFERLIAPAIADLQCEAPGGFGIRTRHYLAICVVLICALARDFRLDLRTAFEADARQQVWRRAAMWYLAVMTVTTLAALRGAAHWSWGFGTFLTTFEMEGSMPWHLLSEGQASAALVTALLQGLVNALPFAMAAAAFHLCRQDRRRTIVATTIVALAITAVSGLSARPLRAGADRVLYETVAPQVANPERAVGDTQHWKEWLQARQRELDGRTAFWMDLQNALMVVPFALFGVVLARRRGWGVLSGVLHIVLTLILVMATGSLAIGSFFPLPPFPQGQWLGVASMLVAGVLRLWLDGRRATVQVRA